MVILLKKTAIWGDKVLFTNKSPREVIGMLKTKDFETAFLAGGGQLNSSFIEDDLIDEIYLDVEPLIFGKGIPVFAAKDFEVELELLEIKKLNLSTVQLHYRVVK
jgi:dihydrofolate reductase